MSNHNIVAVVESYPMNGGDGEHSYSKNSSLQRDTTRLKEAKIQEEIMGKLDIRKLSSASDILRIADLGCSVGPNTFIAMNNVIEAMKHKFQIQDPSAASKMPEFHVFFNDHSSNDFNTLFASLPIPPERQYFAAGVPGSFHTRLFPQSSLHFAYSSHALHWLSKVPEKVLDKNSPNTSIQSSLVLDLLGSCLMDMAKEETISESLVDSFNFPVYFPSAKEMKEIIEKNGCFSIERLETTHPLSEAIVKLDTRVFTAHSRAANEGIISKHFGNKIIDELFDRFHKKAEENSSLLNNPSYRLSQLFVVLIRK